MVSDRVNTIIGVLILYVKRILSYTRILGATTILFFVFSIGNGLLSQSADIAYDNNNRFSNDTEITIKVYPNPATDYVIVSTEKKFKGNYKLNNIFGKVLQEGKLNNEGKNIDLLEFRTGIYIISIYDEVGNKVGTRKIIKN